MQLVLPWIISADRSCCCCCSYYYNSCCCCCCCSFTHPQPTHLSRVCKHDTSRSESFSPSHTDTQECHFTGRPFPGDILSDVACAFLPRMGTVAQCQPGDSALFLSLIASGCAAEDRAYIIILTAPRMDGNIFTLCFVSFRG